jgi:hypothetical protein
MNTSSQQNKQEVLFKPCYVSFRPDAWISLYGEIS